jgi:hypothetical protein
MIILYFITFDFRFDVKVDDSFIIGGQVVSNLGLTKQCKLNAN